MGDEEFAPWQNENVSVNTELRKAYLQHQHLIKKTRN
jgi:hypothetical protein